LAAVWSLRRLSWWYCSGWSMGGVHRCTWFRWRGIQGTLTSVLGWPSVATLNWRTSLPDMICSSATCMIAMHL
jgi:hypothetical protein